MKKYIQSLLWKSSIAIVIVLLSFFSRPVTAQTTLIDPAGAGGFELGATFAANGWTLVNGVGVTNQWFLGTVPVLFPGSNSAYVSNDVAGATHNYATIGSIVHFYRDITIPAGETNLAYSYQWYCQGESTFDFWQVSVGPTSIVPVAANGITGSSPLANPLIPGTTVIGAHNLQSTLQTTSGTISSASLGNCFAPVTIRIFFTWRNDGSVFNQPPAAIDNISLISSTPAGVPLAGTIPVGPTGTYLTLTAAVNAVNTQGVSAPVILELEPTYTGAGETFPITMAGQGSCFPLTSVNTATIRPAAGSPLLTIPGTNAGPTIEFNTGNWWRIDGRPGGVGTTKGLIISNSSTTGQAIRFINDGSRNIVRYCDVQGVNTSTTSGVVLFSTTTSTGGNDNNLIEFCDIHDGATTPTNCIFSSGTSTSQNHFNSNNTIANNNIYNFFFSTGASIGMILTTGSTEWTITGNSFYQTVARTLAAAQFSAINLPLTTSNYFTITNNFIGGSAPQCGGSAMTLTGAGNLRAINATVGPGTTIVQGNTIQNINLTTSNATGFNGALLLGQGTFTVDNNTIGSLLSNNNIVITASGSAFIFCGIILGGTSPTNTSTISNNSVGGIGLTVSGVPATPGSIRCISVQGTVTNHNYIVTGNTVGSTTVANNITADGNVSGSIIGIVSFSNAFNQQFSNNTVSNLTSTNPGTTNIMWGMLLQGTSGIATFTATNNTVQNLTLGSGNVANFSLNGLQVTPNLSTTGTNIVQQNTVRDLLQSNATTGSSVAGMVISLPLMTSNLVARNFVYSLNMSSTTLTGSTVGILIVGGSSNYRNNMIRLGVDGTGASITNGYGMTGIQEVGGTNNIHFNSVYIGGSGVSSGASNTFGLNSTVAAGARNYLSNIFYNARSNGAGTGKHYAIALAGTTPNPAGLASNYNDLFSNGTGGFTGLFNAVDQLTLANWRTATGNDFQSVSGDPLYILPGGSSATVDLHIQAGSPTPVEGGAQPVIGATDDFDGQARASLTPSDIGADAGNFVLADVSGPGISFTPLLSGCGTTDLVLNGVNITDGTGIPTVGALIPRIYFRKNAGAYFSRPGVLASGSSTNSVWNFTIVVADMGGIASGDIVEYYVIAQDNLGLIGSNAGGAVATDVNTVTTHPVTPNSITVLNVLNGTYTVGVGGNYTTLTSAVADYNTRCIGGPIVFSLIDATYPTETFPITINSNAAASSTNTLTIKPAAGNTASISGLAASALIILNGADWVTIDGSNGSTPNTICPPSAASQNLTLTNTSTSTTSAVIWLQTVTGGPNGASNNNIINCIISGNGPLQTLCGIGSGSATISTASLGTNNNNNSFINNAIRNAQYGVITQGNSAFNKNSGNVISQNQMNTASPQNLATGGVFATFEDGIVISGNNISGMAQTSSPDVCAINVGFLHSGLLVTTFAGNECTNATITNNIIGTVINSGTFSAAGIALASAASGTSLIANNMIYGVSANGTSSDFAGGIVLGAGVGSTTNVFYNTVSMQGTVAGATSGSTVSAALAVTNSTPASNLNIKNNILSNTQVGNTGTATTKFTSIGLGYASTPGNYAGLTSDFNDLYAAGPGPGSYQVGITGGLLVGPVRITMANWRTETGKDINSFNVAPVFVSGTDVHLATSANSCLDGGAMPIAITSDIDCQTRDLLIPDIGADEFTGPAVMITIAETSGVAPNDGIICAGDSATLTAIGGDTYLWSTGETTASIIVTPITTTPYSVTVTSGACVEVLSATITVTPLPIAAIAVTDSSGLANNDGIICASGSATLTASGGGTYLWSTGETTAVIVVSPASTTPYTVTVTNANACTATATTTITVTPLPTPGITGNTSACIGSTVTLTATGGGTYLWATGETTPSISFPMPGAPSVICVTVTDNGCSSSTCVGLTPLFLPVVTITGPDAVCPGDSATLQATPGLSAYIWSTGESTSAITVFPAVPTNYTVTVTGSNGCTATASKSVGINPVPQYTFTITDVSNCNTADGAINITITAGQAPLTFSWTSPNGCGVNASAQNQSGICAGSYFMTVTDASGCSNTGVFFVDGPAPGCFSCPSITSLSAVPTPVCPDVPITLTASGLAGMGVTYGIEFKHFAAPTMTPYVGGTTIATVPNAGLGGGGTSAQTVTSFAAPGTYYIYAILSPVPTDPGCTPSATTTVVINPIPTGPTAISETSGIEPNDGIICNGASVVLTAAGGSSSYFWSTGDTTQIITVTPTATTTYTVTLTNGFGCSNAISTTITVDSLPTAGIVPPSAAICSGSPVTLTATGGGTYLWSTGATTAAITVSPTGTTIYTVTVTNANACTDTASVTVNVVPVPQVNAVANQTYCAGSSVPSVVFSSATPGAVFSWSRTAEAIGLPVNNGTGNVPAFTATNAGTAPLTATFSVVASVTSNGITCTGTPIQFTITINPTPQVNAIANQTYCAGAIVPSIVFAGNVPGATYSWSRTAEAIGLPTNNGTGNVPSFTATNTGITPLTATFSVVASYTNNGVTCTGTPIQFTITINPVPTINAVASQTYCAGSSVPAINFTSNVPGLVFNWTRTNVPIGAIPTMGVGSVPTFIATNAGNTPISSVFSVTATYTNNGVSCTSAPITFTITVNPTPVITPVPNRTFCEGSLVPPTIFTSNVPGAVFTWSWTGDNIGLGPVSGTGPVPSFIGVNNTPGPLTSTFTVVATYSNNGVTCTSAPIQFTITICYTLSGVNILGDAYVCPGEIETYFIENYNPNSTYTWTLQNGGGVIIEDNGSNITVEWQDPPGGPFIIAVDEGACGDACHAYDYMAVYVQGVDAVSCNDLVQISLGPDCEAVVLSGMILEGEAEGNDNYFVIITDENGNVIPEATLTSEHLGQCFTVTVVNECNDQSCWGTICVEDKIPPTIECRDVVITCGAPLPTEPAPSVVGPQEIVYLNVNDPLDLPPGQNITYDYEFDFSYLPVGTPVQDVDIRFTCTDHSFTGDVNVIVFSPSGTQVDVFEVGGCAGAFPIDTWFDDEGVNPVDCNGLDLPRIFPIYNAGFSIAPNLFNFDGEDASGIWTIRVFDDFPVLDGGTITNVGISITVNLPAVDPSDGCGEVNLTYVDSQSGDPCEQLLLTRTWTATDGSGNSSTCIQNITINPLTLDSIDFPAAYVGICGESSHPNNTGWPSVDGTPITDEDDFCNIFVGYWDKELNDCGGGRKIARTWTVLNWCTVEVVEAVQVIKLSDHVGPELTCPADFEVGTDFWYCYANVSVPKPGAIDECSEIASYSLTSTNGTVVSFGNNFVINGLELGTHTVTWTVRDECGNSSTCSFHITVVDDVVPVANCDLHTIVALTNDGPSGITLVPASVFDDGSYDNCGPVTFRARRMDSCIDFDWTTEGACIDDTPGGIPPVNSRDRGTVHRPCVPFACCDVGAGPIMVELEVTDAAGNINYCMVETEVQDKISPFVVCPPDIIVSCDFWFNAQEGTFGDSPLDHQGNGNGNLDEDPLSAVFGNMFDAFAYNDDESVRQDIIINDPGNEDYSQPHFWGIDGWADDNCEVTLSVRVRIVDDCSGDDLPGNAPDGAVKMIERRFSATDGNDGVAPGTCTQRIWVVDYDPFFITDQTCNNPNPQDGVIWPCDVLLTTCPEDLGNTGVPTVFDDACSLIGVTYEDTRFDFVDGACFKILREWAVIDWCQYDSQTGAGLWHYTQVIKVHDEEGPTFIGPCETQVLCVADTGVTLPNNNQAFLGEDNPLASSCSAHLNLRRTVHETCSDIVQYDVKLYLFNGSDYIILAPTAAAPVDSNNNAILGFDTRQNASQAIRLNGIPYNSQFCGDYHRILWSVEDGCGNWSHCEYLIRLEDCKQPSPVCINGLSTVVMPVGGQVTVWAKDFNASSFDDCTPSEELLYSFSGDAYEPSYMYTCDNVPAFNVEIATQIWVADGGTDDNCNGIISWNERNKDYCTTTIVITDNAFACDSAVEDILLEGEILTEDIQAVELVAVTLNVPGHVFPTYVTTQNGQYNFTSVIVADDFSIEAERNDAHRNGVSTLDLVKIQKHLLGIEPLGNPYDLIAADANNSQNVSAIDLIELRKLILGIYVELPANKSWRFVDKSFQFADLDNPWPFNESINIPGMNGDVLDQDFVAIKVGDVNNTVQANANQVLPRNGNGIVNFVADNRTVSAGEFVDVAISSADFAAIEGYQFTMQTNGLEFRGVSGGLVSMSDENVGVFGSTLTASWHKVGGVNATSSDVLFTLTFEATAAGQLSEMISLNSKVTEAEAYNTSSDIKDLKLTFRGSEHDAEFALYQNEPNPFKGNTLIGYDLPVAGNVVLSIFDVTGKVLVVKEQESVKGYNTISVSSKDIPSVGVLYYRLDANEYTATKKMVIIQ